MANGITRWIKRRQLRRTSGLLLGLGLLLAFVYGCASTPTGLDRAFADVQTNYVPVLVLRTNIVELTQTNTVVQTVTVTNQVGQPVPVFLTNTVNNVTYQTNVVLATNIVPQYVLTASTNTTATASIVGGVVNGFVPGVGGLVTTGLLGLLSIFLGVRNRQFAGQNDALSQSAGVLTQIIETGREVLSKTPQGQQAADAFTAWMVSHQAETNTIAAISQIVKANTDNTQAQAAADQILALVKKG